MRTREASAIASRPLLWASLCFLLVHSSSAFEGRLRATLTRGGQVQTLLYTVATNQMRIERAETDWPYARNIVNLESGALTLLFPNNRSFVRLKGGANTAAALPAPSRIGTQGLPGDAPAPARSVGPANFPGAPAPPGLAPRPAMPQMPPGVGPQAGPRPGAATMPPMPMMPAAMEQAELKATDQTTNILGFPCTRYELKQRGEVMEIWATAQLPPFQNYLQNQPHRIGPRMIEEQWGEMLKAKKLFPLLAVLKFENGPERLRFTVKSITPGKIKQEDADGLFQPPPEYQELQPLPF